MDRCERETTAATRPVGLVGVAKRRSRRASVRRVERVFFVCAPCRRESRETRLRRKRRRSLQAICIATSAPASASNASSTVACRPPLLLVLLLLARSSCRSRSLVRSASSARAEGVDSSIAPIDEAGNESEDETFADEVEGWGPRFGEGVA